ncbi:hypothetical protein T484DRAFT_1885078, partial [Baffinella frigidus]
MQELVANLKMSELKFFDPAKFIRACKVVDRTPRLLDQTHTQDDTMTFLEGVVDVLGSVHGSHLEVFKIIEKERRWLDETNEPRPINSNEREYLMLEIEEGIGDLQHAMAKHFSVELMTGDNRIWNEATQAKETVWKQPFIERASLPEVLAVQLKRFKHSQRWDGSIEAQKLNCKVEFPEQLDVSAFVGAQTDPYEAVAAPPGSDLYELQGVIVHSGQTIHSGHYYSFVHHPTKGWFKIDDDTATSVSVALVFDEGFGGTVESKDQMGDIRREDRWRSAYVLFYRRAGTIREWPEALMERMAPLRSKVEQASLGAARQLLAFDQGFSTTVHDIVRTLARSLAPAGASAGAKGGELGGGGGANGGSANGSQGVSGVDGRVGGAEDMEVSSGSADSPLLALAVPPPAVLVARGCRLGALFFARVLSRKEDCGVQAGDFADELQHILKHSPDGARALIRSACARPPHTTPSETASEAGPSASEEGLMDLTGGG